MTSLSEYPEIYSLLLKYPDSNSFQKLFSTEVYGYIVNINNIIEFKNNINMDSIIINKEILKDKETFESKLNYINNITQKSQYLPLLIFDTDHYITPQPSSAFTLDHDSIGSIGELIEK
jgi:hypothetical protein